MAPAKRKRRAKANPPGRPSKLTEDVRTKILDGIKAGLPLERAAVLGGVSGRAFFQWMERGAGRSERPAHAVYVQFAQDVAHARVEAEQAALAAVKSGVMVSGFPDWKAADRWLERSMPHHYSDAATIRDKVSAELADVLARVREELDPETFRRVAEVLRRVRGPVVGSGNG